MKKTKSNLPESMTMSYSRHPPEHLNKFATHLPIRARKGADPIGNFTAGFNASIFNENMDLKTGLERVAILEKTLEDRVLNDDFFTAGEIDEEMMKKGGSEAAKHVNRWKYIGQKFKAKKETAHLESELNKTLEGLAKAVEDLEDCLKAQVKK